MKTGRYLLLGIALCGVFASEASAQGTFWDRFKLDVWRMRCWPEPFRQTDRQVTRDPFTIVKDNGWRLHNTLGDAFFDKERHGLTRAGEIKVRWIATQAPTPRRTVYVLRAENSEMTQNRVASVQEYLAKIAIEGQQVEVLLTDSVPSEGSGEYYDAVDRQFKSSIPPPRITSGGGGGGGGGTN